MTWFAIVQWLHVLAAVVAVGANATYGVWLARSARRPDVLPFTLETVRFIDDRIANPTYVVLAITGVILMFIGPYKWTAPWVIVSSILFVILAVVALTMLTPALRRMVGLAEAGKAGAPEFVALARRVRTIGPMLGILAFAILFFMVTGPLLWP